jgi:NAD(P)-dependent dehydrogenase (short-subunit alcohol dehydrogenase family)
MSGGNRAIMNSFSLDGKVVLITGASSGIGRACAIRISEAGGAVIITGRNRERLNETRSKLSEGKHFSFVQDLLDLTMTEANISTAVEALGKIDGFIHAAGIEMTMPLRQLTPDHYRKIYNVNIIAGFELAKIISYKRYLSDSGGSFVFVSSVMGFLGKPGLVGYCSSKAALLAGSKAMALELAPKKIRVNNILPGVIEDTEMTRNLFRMLPEESQKDIVRMHPLGLGRTEDVALGSIFLLSDAARWITGADIVIDGGYSAQ